MIRQELFHLGLVGDRNGRAILPGTCLKSAGIGKFQTNGVPLTKLLPDDVYDFCSQRVSNLAIVLGRVKAITGGRILQRGGADAIVCAAIPGSQGLIDFDHMVRKGAMVKDRPSAIALVSIR